MTPKISFATVATINAAIVTFSKAIADQGIEVNTVLPGPVLTDRRSSFLKRRVELHSTTAEQGTRIIPVKSGKAEEVASLIGFLLSSDARWMTGSAILMDGGEIKSI
jgi:NAD(P)-dependent dehydrogenase (short-subunit alcohol dehydrogenase family)